MTGEQAKQKLLTWVSAQVGTHEGINNWNKYAENIWLTKLYGWKAQNQPWCDIFVDVAFIECFGLEKAAEMTYQPIGAGSALCRQSAKYYKDHGAFYNKPETGDQIFFYASGDINHTGIVVKVSGGSVFTVEGNSSDMVAERCYSMSDSKIAGYGRPKWDAAADVSTQTSNKSNVTETISQAESKAMTTVCLPVLRNGMGGGAVAAMQGCLAYQKLNLGVCGVDGDFGVSTLAAVRNFQTRNGLTVDGICGQKTWEALLK